MKLFEMTYGEGDEIFAMSVVSQPAIEEEAIFLATQDKPVKLSLSEDKRMIVGAALVPNKAIYRKDGEEEYYIYFSKETVAKAARDFISNGNQNTFTLEHSESTDKISVVESWIVENEETDKANSIYNLEAPEGSWILMSHVEDKDFWMNTIKSGTFSGYSLEGKFGNQYRRELSDQKLDTIVEKITDAVNEYMISTK